MSTSKKSYVLALRDTLAEEMRRDDNVIILGEDIAGGKGRGEGGRSADAWGGPFGKTRDLATEFGENRVFDTPISETGFVGMAVGAAVVGLRPVVDLSFSDFIGVCFDQILNQMAKLRYMSDGQVSVPLVISTGTGGGIQAGSQHSGSLYSILTHLPGIKVVAPATPADAKGLMTTAIRDDDPVFIFEHKRLYAMTGEVPDGEHLVPFGKARIARAGTDLTLIGISGTVQLALDAAEELAQDGVEAEVIDLRSLSPLDTETLCESAARTGRVVVVDEAPPRCGMAADLASIISQEVFDDLVCPVRTVTAAHTPTPFAPSLEAAVLPTKDRVLAAARSTLERNTRRAETARG